MRPLVLSLAAACSVQSTLPTPQAAPPSVGNLIMEVPELYAGEDHSVIVRDAFPGETVYLVGSPSGTGAGPCFDAIGGACLGVTNPVRVVSTAIADSAGVASIPLSIPGIRGGRTYGMQAVAVHGLRGADTVFSEPVLVDTLTRDSDGDGIPDAIDPDGDPDCSPSDHLEVVLWPQVLDGDCTNCHVSGGVGDGTRFVLTPDDPQASAAAVEWAATHTDPGQTEPYLLLKPTGQLPHVGGVRFDTQSSAYATVVDYLSHLDGTTCDPVDQTPSTEGFYDDIDPVDPLSLARRLSLGLGARMPTAQERADVEAQGLVAVDGMLDDLLDSEAFYSRVMEAFGDVLLVEGFTLYTTPETALTWGLFPSRQWFTEGRTVWTEWWEDLQNYDAGVRHEPMQLIRHVLQEDRPFTEIVTADYMVVNPYSARGYDLNSGYSMWAEVEPLFADPTDVTEFVEARLPAPAHPNGDAIESATGMFPHAGILSTPQYVRRHQSTLSNRNRHRARQFYQHFLGVDVMALAPQVSDAAAVTAAFDNPTMDAPECVACHQIIDPVAGLFQVVDEEGYLYAPAEPWYTDMLPPGFNGESIPSTEVWRGYQWLGERVATDPRFATAMTEHGWYVLTQHKVADAPIDDGSAQYSARLRGYLAQREMIDEAAAVFVSTGFDFKAMIRSLALSDYHLADGASGVVDDLRAAELEVLGLHSLLTPEQLNRRVLLLLGQDLGIDKRWGHTSDLLYGGLDYVEVTERVQIPNAVMGAKMRGWANDLACSLISEEIMVGSAGPMPLLPGIDRDTTDEQTIRAAIAHLHWLLLGRADTTDSVEVDQTFALYEAVRTDGLARIAAGTEDARQVWACQPSVGGREDDDYVIRSWNAVFTYLLRRPEFLSQ